jgi:hypothetical protein
MADKLPTITPKDIRPGDILLFTSDGSRLDQIIEVLCDSPYCHVAMGFTPAPNDRPNYSRIINETLKGVIFVNLDDIDLFDPRQMVVRRHKTATDLSPVMAAAEYYFEEKEPYPEENLVFVALLLLYRKVTPQSALQRAMIRYLKWVTKKILAFINEHRFPGKKPMVCSQFIFQCFQDAGGELTLHIENGLLMANNAPTLLDLIDQQMKTNGKPSLPLTIDPNEPSAAEILQELFDALQTPDASGPLTSSAQITDALVGAAAEFCEALTSLAAPQSLQANNSDAVGFVRAQEAVFVTPADLADSCPEIEDIGIMDIPCEPYGTL